MKILTSTSTQPPASRRICGAAVCGSAGSATLSTFVMLFVLSVLGVGAATVLTGSSWFVRRAVGRLEVEHSLEATVRSVMELLVADETPEADSRSDGVWAAIEALEIEVTLSDVSSAVNPNTVRRTLLDRTDLGRLIFDPVGGETSDSLQQHREDLGRSTDIAGHYSGFFREDAVEELLTGFGWANINITDEFVLRSIYAERTGDAGRAEQFRNRAVEIIGREEMVSPTELAGFLGADYERVFPVVNAQPAWNVHFLPEDILRAILSYPALGVESPDLAATEILGLRRTGELLPEDLYRITGLPATSRLHQYLGVRTWFWQITAQLDSRRLTAVVARVPGESERLQIVERTLGSSGTDNGRDTGDSS